MDLERIRRFFPILQRRIDDRPLVYLDNAATSLKPEPVLEAELTYYREVGANVHRGRHALSEEASHAFESARSRIARFLGARSSDEIVFTANATAAMNLVAEGLELRRDDEIITTINEHHSSILPWLARATVRFVDAPIDEPLALEAIQKLIGERTRAIVLAHASNVTGTVQPVEELCRLAEQAGISSVIDAAQSAPHMRIDLQRLGCDFLVLSGHKMLGPTGIGILCGKADSLARLVPRCLGGGVVTRVSMNGFGIRELPARLEPGTPNIAGAIGLAAATTFLEEIGMEAVHARCQTLATLLREELGRIAGLQVLMGRGSDTLPIASLSVPGLAVSLDDLAVMLSDNYGIMTRAGLQCAHPLFHARNLPGGALRVSAYFYNTETEIRYFAESLAELLAALR